MDASPLLDILDEDELHLVCEVAAAEVAAVAIRRGLRSCTVRRRLYAIAERLTAAGYRGDAVRRLTRPAPARATEGTALTGRDRWEAQALLGRVATTAPRANEEAVARSRRSMAAGRRWA